MAQIALFVAYYMLCHNTHELTSLHINKLVFLAHGWNLGLCGKPLINEKVEAWKLGPVIPSLYHAFKGYGEKTISPRQHLETGNNDEKFNEVKDSLAKQLGKDEKCIIDQVLEHYGDWSAWDLVNLTHEDDTPWSNYYEPDQRSVVIPNDDIQQYYQELKNGT